MEFFKQRTTIDFMGRARLALIFSGALILIGILSVAFRGGLKYGIDFAGGTLVQLKFKEPPSLDHVRDGLKNLGLGDSAIQEFGSRSEILIRVQKSEEKLEDVGSRIKNGLEQALVVKDIVVDRVEIVGPKVGKDLRMKALLSIFYSLIGILIYIAWRFELRYAVGAIIATVHDVIITLGAFSLLNMEFDLVVVAGFLTLIGYSLNDTIVVYDRVRENVRRESKTPLFDVINASVNQTLSRTILTSGCTLLVVIALYFFGGEIIHGFAFSLLVGIFVGTYSSIFIASVCVLFWENKSLSFKRA